ncbi:MAG: SDR family oxidoreductase [Cytophagales bacterium]|nr:SDR family oxidoreductase [Bernardetiaceae bacterium]MDW8205655.1 SDR family oxidoreductase [Cytophagales bacterium]
MACKIAVPVVTFAMMQTISILGCGWLGMPLARRLSEMGYRVKGATRTPEKLAQIEAQGATACWVTLPAQNANDQLSELLVCDLLIINIPPQRRHAAFSAHEQHIDYLTAQMKKQQSRPHIIYVSSTSVYRDTHEVVTENAALNSPQEDVIVYAEQLLHNQWGASILRCGGLMGYDRIPGKYFIGRVVDTGDIPVNFIHRDDVIGLLLAMIQQKAVHQVYNAVAPLHPTRREVYLANAAKFGWQPPVFVPPAQPLPYKIVSSEKAMRELGYRFQFPDPLQFHYTP